MCLATCAQSPNGNIILNVADNVCTNTCNGYIFTELNYCYENCSTAGYITDESTRSCSDSCFYYVDS